MRYDELRSKSHELDPREVLAQYAHLSVADFRALLITLKARTEAREELSDEEQLLVRYAHDFEKLRHAEHEAKLSANMLCDAASEPLRFRRDFELTPATVKAWRIDVTNGRREHLEDVESAFMRAVAEDKAVVLYGSPGLGKTPLARAFAAFVALCDLEKRKVERPAFVFSGTVDALRKLCEQGSLADAPPIVLDEWAPRQTACGPQAGGIDSIKNILDASGTRTVAARYSDMALPSGCARIVTTQCLSKIVPALDCAEFATPENVLDLGDDVLAVLKRAVFFRVQAAVIPQQAREAFVGDRREARFAAMKAQ
jgi:hypothetical protein